MALARKLVLVFDPDHKEICFLTPSLNCEHYVKSQQHLESLYILIVTSMVFKDHEKYRRKYQSESHFFPVIGGKFPLVRDLNQPKFPSVWATQHSSPVPLNIL